MITATNKDLVKEVKDGRFREDLYFRLTALTIHVPPLRERKDDIPLLSRYMLNRFHQRTGKKVMGISMQAQAALMAYDWPGNVRELENLIEHLAILTTEQFLRLEDLPPGIRGRGAAAEKGADVNKRLDQVVRGHIEAVLGQLNGNQSRAACPRHQQKGPFEKDKYSIRTGRPSQTVCKTATSVYLFLQLIGFKVLFLLDPSIFVRLLYKIAHNSWVPEICLNLATSE